MYLGIVSKQIPMNFFSDFRLPLWPLLIPSFLATLCKIFLCYFFNSRLKNKLFSISWLFHLFLSFFLSFYVSSSSRFLFSAFKLFFHIFKIYSLLLLLYYLIESLIIFFLHILFSLFLFLILGSFRFCHFFSFTF